MASQPKEYLVAIGARIPEEDYVRILKHMDEHGGTVADCVRHCVGTALKDIPVGEEDDDTLMHIRCMNYERKKRYARR